MSNVLEILKQYEICFGDQALEGTNPFAYLPAVHQDRNILFNVGYTLLHSCGQHLLFCLQFEQEDLELPIAVLTEQIKALHAEWYASERRSKLNQLWKD